MKKPLNFKYDVFVSYRQQDPDRDWVKSKLVPRLDAEGLKVFVDYRDFRLGRSLILEMERAVTESKYTLAVMTPAYLGSNFTELENIMAQQLGLERSESRLLAVMREQCTPRLGIGLRLWLDMTNDADFDSDIARLVLNLKQSPSL